MNDRRATQAGAFLGALWAAAVVWMGVAVFDIPIFALTATLYLAFLGPGLVIGGMSTVFAIRYAWGKEPISEREAAMRSAARSLLVLAAFGVVALCLWPAIGFLSAVDGPGLLVSLSISFTLTGFLFWMAEGSASALRTFSLTATILPTPLAMLWAGLVWII